VYEVLKTGAVVCGLSFVSPTTKLSKRYAVRTGSNQDVFVKLQVNVFHTTLNKIAHFRAFFPANLGSVLKKLK